MDMLGNDTEHLFLLPVALIPQNELGTSDRNEYGYSATTTRDIGPNQTGENLESKEIVLGEPQRLEKIGDVIRKELKWTFILHTYGFGCLFFILAFYTFFSILNIRSFISSRPFMSTINGFLCLLGASRATSLFIDPYNLKENMPRLFGQVLWDLGFPSIISAFSLVQLAFLQFTQFQVGPEGLRRKSCLSLIVTAHFLLTIAMDIVVASHENLMILKHVVHYVFLTWGVFLCSNFLYGGYKIMSMIKSLPEGLKHGDLHDASYKGIIQLAMLAPHNNFSGSMTAALLPTLCAPKIHQQNNSNLSSVGFKNDGNSRILESESIPMLEELTGSSADEVRSKPLVRASSFQNQTRNSQKFNLKPKLYLKSNTYDSKDQQFSQEKRTGAMSVKSSTPKDHFPKSTSPNTKPTNGILKNRENFITSQSTREFKGKLHQRTCFENENFRFANEKKGRQNAGIDNLVPEILVSSPASSETGQPHASDAEDERVEKTFDKLVTELPKDLTEMHVLREDKSNKSEQVAEVPNSARGTCDSGRKKGVKNASEIAKCCAGRSEFTTREKGWKLNERPNPRNGYNDLSVAEMGTTSSEAPTEGSSPKEFSKFEETRASPRKARSRRKGKSLSWKKNPENEEEEATQECLLLQEQSTDAALRSALNHMAYINRGAPSSANCDEDVEKVRKSKVEWVLNITYITAMWGLMLCLSYMGKIYSSFGLPEPRKTVSRLNSIHSQGGAPTGTLESGIQFSSWPWLWFQTFCRALELAMGCAMANITRQPTANSRHSPSLIFRPRNPFYNI